VIAVSGRFEFPRSFNDDPVLAHQSPDTPVPHVDTNLLQLFGHPGPSVAAQAQARLLLDMRQNDHVHVLPTAGGAAAGRPQATWTDIHNPAQAVDGESPTLFFDEPEPHGVGHSLGPLAFMPSMAREELGGFS
jgi:hypothetical protein